VAAPVLTVNNIEVIYNDVILVLKGLSLQVEEGAVVALLGAALGWLAIQFGRFNDQLFEQLGPIKHAIVIGLLLCMMGVLGKIVLRLLFGIKYLISLPAFSLNI